MIAAREVQDLSYHSEGAEVPARLYRPQDPAGSGILLLPGRTRQIELLEFLALAAARQGATVLASRYRGMELRHDDADARSGLDELLTADVDANRLAIVGQSRGGSCALRVAAADHRLKTIVSLQPPVDLARIVKATAFLSRERYQTLIGQIGGTPDEVPARYQAASALPIADRIKVPCLLLAGSIDLYAPAEHIKEMFDAMKAAGNTKSEYVVFDCGHFFETIDYKRLNEQIASLVTDWLGSHL
jgi:dipeptidyl aminopeptidase/acylaminoacyl peptidase